MKSVLIVHQGAIGDFILSLPPLEAIHRSYSEARFVFLGHPSILEIIHSRPYFGDVLDCAESVWAPLYNSKERLVSGAFNSLPPVDTIFAFCRSSSQTLADNLAGFYGKPSHRIDPFPHPGLGLHVSEYQCRQLEELGISALPSPAAVIAPSQQDFLGARRFIKENVAKKNKLLLLHPGSGGSKKLWTTSGWLDLIRRMSTHDNLQIAMLQGPADTEIVQQLCSQVGANSLLLINNWPLGKLAALIKESALYLGNDSGITHLAAACAIPTIALFGPTDARIWGPQGPQVSIARWQPESSAYRQSKTNREPPPETKAVWKLVRTWLGI